MEVALPSDPTSPRSVVGPPFLRNGGMGIRTPGLVIANDALYQLSYTPESASENYHDEKICHSRSQQRRFGLIS